MDDIYNTPTLLVLRNECREAAQEIVENPIFILALVDKNIDIMTKVIKEMLRKYDITSLMLTNEQGKSLIYARKSNHPTMFHGVLAKCEVKNGDKSLGIVVVDRTLFDFESIDVNILRDFEEKNLNLYSDDECYIAISKEFYTAFEKR